MGAAAKLKASGHAHVEIEYPPKSGLVWRCRHIVALDLLLEHRALLGAVAPPDMATRMMRLSAEAEPESKAVIDEQITLHMIRLASNPETVERAEKFARSVVIAAVVAMKGPDDTEFTPIRLVEEGAGDEQAVPELVPLDALPAGTVDHLQAIIRQDSFGGEAGAARVASFRYGPGNGATGGGNG